MTGTNENTKITMDIPKCPLCGAKHATAKFRAYNTPLVIGRGIVVTHFYPCDSTNQPILLTQEEAEAAKRPAEQILADNLNRAQEALKAAQEELERKNAVIVAKEQALAEKTVALNDATTMLEEALRIAETTKGEAVTIA